MTKNQMVMGLSKYIKEVMSSQIPDVMSRRVMSGIADVLTIRPEITENIMRKYPIIKMFESDNGEYDIDAMEEVLRQNIAEYGNITLNILGANLTFTIRDLDDIVRIYNSI